MTRPHFLLFPCASDDALHQLDVAQSPAHNQFVEFGEALADVNPIAIAVLVSVQRQALRAPERRIAPAPSLLSSTCSLPIAAQRLEEHVVQGRLAQPPLQLRVALPALACGSGAFSRPSDHTRNSSSRNCSDWNPLAGSSLPRNARKWVGSMVSRIVNCSTSTRVISVQRRNRRAASYTSSRD